MKVVIAIDSFKGSLSSLELSNSIESGIKMVYPEAEVIKLPVADGGEGTIDTLVQGDKGNLIEVEVKNPLGKLIKAKYGILKNNVAVIEMAQASGLPLISKEERNPLLTSTYGTGQLIKDALEKGCKEFIVGIGGSATNDGGTGMLEALGVKFYDSKKNLLKACGEVLKDIYSFDLSGLHPLLKESKFLIACDVDNPFYGPKGAAEIYSRQKGATEEMVSLLDKGLEHFAMIIKRELKRDISILPGAGAAGGLGGGFVAFLDSILKPGIDIVLQHIELKKHLISADFVITGEGRIDFQSIMGKTPVGVSKLAKEVGIPVIALAGSVTDDAIETHNYGIGAIFSIINSPITLEEAMSKNMASKLVKKNAEEVFRLIKICQDKFTK